MNNNHYYKDIFQMRVMMILIYFMILAQHIGKIIILIKDYQQMNHYKNQKTFLILKHNDHIHIAKMNKKI